MLKRMLIYFTKSNDRRDLTLRHLSRMKDYKAVLVVYSQRHKANAANKSQTLTKPDKKIIYMSEHR